MACLLHSAVLGHDTLIGEESPNVAQGEISLWRQNECLVWAEGTAPKSEWSSIVSVTGHVTQASQVVQIH